MASPVRLGVLISGGGRTLQNFIDLSAAGRLKAEVVKVVSNRSDAYGLERARLHGIPYATIRRGDFRDVDEFSAAIIAELEAEDVELVAMAGFLLLWRIPDRYAGRVMNIHPALLPSFGGEGFYGDRVHQAVLDYGCKVSGCTVHFADNVYDHGPVIVQRAVTVAEGDDVHSLAARVFEMEKEAYPEAINLFAEGRLQITGRWAKVCPPGGGGV
ncbi:MAG: phosphoribosylglycinamide formyltransferase [Planctomycetota bacterium]|jgi:formyltetrahydrofolate-dependent phosphoribosylglycinamide formyltransferase